MSVVRLFPIVNGAGQAEAEVPESRRGEAGPAMEPAPPTAPARSAAPPGRARRIVVRSVSPAEILARGAGRPAGSGANLTPAAVIAHALGPPPLERFWAIWLVHQDFLRHRSLRLAGGNRADAEDALSTAMVRAAHAFARQPVQNPRAWLLRILHNACVDVHRQNANRTPIQDEMVEEPPPSAVGVWAEAGPSPEEALSRIQLKRAWMQAMDALPSALIDPLRLHLDDWSDDDIAAHLNISRELVRKRRQLAKDRLKAILRL